MLEAKDKTESIEAKNNSEDEDFFRLDDNLDIEFRKLCSKINHLFKKLRGAFSTENIEWSTSTYKYFHYTKLYIDKIIEPLICKNVIQWSSINRFKIIQSLLDVNYNTLEKKASKSLAEIESAAFSSNFEELEELIIHNLKHEKSDFLWFFKQKYDSFIKVIKSIFYENGLIEKLSYILNKLSDASILKAANKINKLLEKAEFIKSILFEKKWTDPFRAKVYFFYVHEKRCEYNTKSNLWECAERYRIIDFFEASDDLNCYYNPMLFCFFKEKKLEQFINKMDKFIHLLKQIHRLAALYSF